MEMFFNLQRFNSIKNTKNSTLVSGTSGSDFVDNSGSCVTIEGGVGNDTIYNSQSEVTIDGGLDNDYIYNNMKGNHTSMNGGSGNDTIKNYFSEATINGGTGNDSIFTCGVIGGDNVTIDCGDGDDTVSNVSSNALIIGGDGNDSLHNTYIYTDHVIYTENVTLYGGEGDDIICNTTGDYLIMDGGIGNDSINNYIGNNISIVGGKGNDSIYNNGENITIDGGEGDDSIRLVNDSKNAVVQYATGDGNDTISGFSTSDTLHITSGTISNLVLNGNDLILTVGNGSIRLTYIKHSALNLKVANDVVTTLKVSEISSFTEGDDTYENNTSNTVLSALGGNDSILNNKANVTIDGGAGNDTIKNHQSNNVLINGSEGNDYIYNTYSYNSTLYGGIGNDTIYNAYDDNLTINGEIGNDSIVNDGSYSEIFGGDGNDTIIVGLNLNTKKNTITGNTGDDLITLRSNGDEFWDSENNIIKYASGDGNDTVYGFNTTDTLYITSGTISNSVISGNNLILTVSNGSITFKDVGESVFNLKLADGTVTTLKAEEEIPTWKISGTTATYSTTFKTLCTITGLKSGFSANNLSLSGNTVTVNANALSTGTVAISGNYNLALASDVAKPSTTAAGWNISGTTANYISESTTAGYTLSSDRKSISYTGESGGNTLATITGLKSGFSANNLSLSGNTVTVNANALSTGTVSISGNYNLALASDVAKPSITEAGWNISGTTAKYISESTTAGYTLSSNKKSISYTAESGGETLTTITGLKKNTSADNLSLSENTVTIKAAALSTSKVTISNGYKLALASDVAKPSTTKAKWSKSGTTAIYKSKKISAGYTLSSNKKSITYTQASGGSQLIKITGLKNTSSTAGISVKNKVVSVKSTAMANNKKVSVTGSGYRFNITGTAGKNTIIGGANADTLNGGSGNDVLTGGNGNDLFIYSAGNDSITDYTSGDKIKISTNYTGSVSGGDVILTTSAGSLTVKNMADKNIVINGKTKKFSSSTSKTLTITNSSKNEIELSANYINADASKRTKSVEIVGNSKNNSLVGGSKADTIFGGTGKNTLTGGKGADKFLHSAGNDVITDYTAEDTIYLIDTEIIGTKFYVDDLIWTTDNSSLTIKNGLNKKITYYDSESNPHVIDYQNVSYSNDFTVLTVKKNFAGDEIDLSDYADTVKKVNASAVTDNISIIGNARNNSLVGGSGSDIIFGGSGNDTLKGGNGRDIFVHNTGDDVITDYKAGQDKIYLDNTKITKKKVGDNDITFTTSTGTLTVKNGTGKKITFVDKDGNEETKQYSANITELDFIMDDNSISDFEDNQTERFTQDNLITYAK